MTQTPIPPGSVIGIIGGGQLGRMTALAAATLGYRVHVFSPQPDSPTGQVATRAVVADYQDTQALEAFVEEVDVVTFEFENVPHESVAMLESHCPVRPGWEVLKTCRNRNREKEFITSCGIGTAPFHPVRSAADLKAAVEAIGTPSILKTAELGYDGKGQVKLESSVDAEAAWNALGEVECVLEGFVDFAGEMSVIVVRGTDGQSVCYGPVENIHRDQILHKTIAPGNVSTALTQQAHDMAKTLAEKLDMIGVLAVELFLTKENTLLVNELAPRPHNSGHYSIEACRTSQFENFVRAVCGLPLGSTELIVEQAEMTNLLGDEADGWLDYLSDPEAKLHLYGKTDARPGRKMGHITRVKRAG